MTDANVVTADGVEDIDLLGVQLGDQQIDVVSASAGRLPTAIDEILVTEGFAAFAPIGTTLDVRSIGKAGRQVAPYHTGG